MSVGSVRPHVFVLRPQRIFSLRCDAASRGDVVDLLIEHVSIEIFFWRFARSRLFGRFASGHRYVPLALRFLELSSRTFGCFQILANLADSDLRS